MHTTTPTPATTTTTFQRFFQSEKSGGILLIACTVVALLAANSPFGEAWLHAWERQVAGLSIALWVNDALMAIFFLLVGPLSLMNDGLRDAFDPTSMSVGKIKKSKKPKSQKSASKVEEAEAQEADAAAPSTDPKPDAQASTQNEEA